MDALPVLWPLAGLVGMGTLLAKGKLNFGLWTWIFFGWWGVLFAIVLGGPLLLAWGVMARADKTCQSCRRNVHPDATKCPHCHSALTATAAAG